MMKFCHHQAKYIPDQNQLLEFGCFRKTEQTSRFFLKKRQNSPHFKDQHRELCKVTLQKSSQDSISHPPACKVSLKRENVKTSIKPKEMKIINVQNCCLQGNVMKGSVKEDLKQYFSPRFNYQGFKKKNEQDLSVKYRSLRFIQQVKQTEYRPFKTQKLLNQLNFSMNVSSIPCLMTERPKIIFNLGTRQKIIHPDNTCQIYQNKSKEEYIINRQNLSEEQSQQGKNIFVQHTLDHLDQKPIAYKNESKKTVQRNIANLTKDCSMQSLNHLKAKHNSDDTFNSNISQSSEERSMKSIESDLKLLKNINDVAEVQSVADDNLSVSAESVVLERLNMYSSQMLSSEPSLQDHNVMNEHFQRRLGRISAIMKGQWLKD